MFILSYSFVVSLALYISFVQVCFSLKSQNLIFHPQKRVIIHALTRVRHVEPWGVGDGVQADVGPGREAVLIGLCGEDVKDGQQEADKPGAAHPEQSLGFWHQTHSVSGD